MGLTLRLIEQTPAGPGLDKLVSRYVLGKPTKWVRAEDWGEPASFWRDPARGGYLGVAGTGGGDYLPNRLEQVPAYSVAMGLALSLATDMTDTGFWSFGLWRTSLLSSVMSGWCAGFSDGVYPPLPPTASMVKSGEAPAATGERVWYGYDDEYASAAICRAILRLTYRVVEDQEFTAAMADLGLDVDGDPLEED